MNYYVPHQCLEIDQVAEKKFGVDPKILMENAGRSCANAIMRYYGDVLAGETVALLCGPGHNGGDGFVCARVLADHGIAVRVFHFESPRAKTGAKKKKPSDALMYHLGLIHALEIPYASIPTDKAGAAISKIESHSIFVDALFGIGAKVPFDPFWLKVFEAVNRLSRLTIAIDHPSGFTTHDGWPPNAPAIQAHMTCSISFPKFAHAVHAGPAACGLVCMCDAGFPKAAAGAVAPFAEGIDLARVRAWLKPPPAHAHKNQLGHVGITVGERQMPGAIQLCAQSALACGVGKITLFGDPGAIDKLRHDMPPEIMYAPIEQGDDFGGVLKSRGVSSLIMGPGMLMSADTGMRWLRQALSAPNMALILDAEIFRMTRAAQMREALAKHPESKIAWIGHIGEQALFFEKDAAEAMWQDSIELYRAWLSDFPQHVWLRKGLGSVVATAARLYVNESGNIGLAKGGSGDVLAGIIGALTAQRHPMDAALCSAVWIHGRAADRILDVEGQPESMTPSQCMSEIPGVIKEIYP